MFNQSQQKATTIKYNNFFKWSFFLGLLWLALGVVYIPGNKIYQQGVVLFLYIPVFFLIVSNFSLMKSVFNSEKYFFVALIALFVYAALNGSIQTELKSAKHPLYIFLFVVLGVGLVLADYEQRVKRLMLYFMLTAVTVISVYIMYNFFIVNGYPITARMWGVLGLEHVILASYYIGFFLLLSMFLIVEKKEYVLILVVFILGAYILFAQSRGAYAALFIAMLVYTLLFTRRNKIALYFMAFLLITAVALGFLYQDQIMSRGFSYRPEILKASIELGMKNLWFGIGLDQQYRVFSPSFPEGAWHPHNLLAHIFIELGIVGLVLFSMLWLYSFYYCFMNRTNTIARFNIIWMVFSSLAVQSDAASFIVQPRLEWMVVWVPVFLTAAVIAVNYMNKVELGRNSGKYNFIISTIK